MPSITMQQQATAGDASGAQEAAALSAAPLAKRSTISYSACSRCRGPPSPPPPPPPPPENMSTNVTPVAAAPSAAAAAAIGNVHMRESVTFFHCAREGLAGLHLLGGGGSVVRQGAAEGDEKQGAAARVGGGEVVNKGTGRGGGGGGGRRKRCEIAGWPLLCSHRAPAAAVVSVYNEMQRGGGRRCSTGRQRRPAQDVTEVREHESRR
jgi:hypothetical protein